MAIDGSWDCVVASPMGKQKSVLTLVTAGDTVTGTNAAKMGTDEIVDGQIAEGLVSFKTNMKVPLPMVLTWELTVEGDALTGTVAAGPFGKSPLTGTRAA